MNYEVIFYFEDKAVPAHADDEEMQNILKFVSGEHPFYFIEETKGWPILLPYHSLKFIEVKEVQIA